MTHKDKVVAYLRRYSSKEQPKTIAAIAETLSMDEETVGYVIHELLAHQSIKAISTHSSQGFGYYFIDA